MSSELAHELAQTGAPIELEKYSVAICSTTLILS
jgi:hypothetical protein